MTTPVEETAMFRLIYHQSETDGDESELGHFRSSSADEVEAYVIKQALELGAQLAEWRWVADSTAVWCPVHIPSLLERNLEQVADLNKITLNMGLVVTSDEWSTTILDEDVGSILVEFDGLGRIIAVEEPEWVDLLPLDPAAVEDFRKRYELFNMLCLYSHEDLADKAAGIRDTVYGALEVIRAMATPELKHRGVLGSTCLALDGIVQGRKAGLVPHKLLGVPDPHFYLVKPGSPMDTMSKSLKEAFFALSEALEAADSFKELAEALKDDGVTS